MLNFLAKSLWSWAVFLGVVFRHPLYRLGLLPRPMFTDHYDAAQRAWGQATRWNPRLRVVHPERCPQQPPAIFAANHAKLDDPFFIWRAVHRSTGEQMHCRFVMRDDWGRGPLWKLFPIPFNELGEMAGAVPISRGNVQFSQMKPLLQILQNRGAFIIFPGRTRSRCGLLIEYREGIEEPGGISFFLASGERKLGGTRIPAVPVVRTHNPMTWRSTVVFGEPMYLPPGASRAEQRAFDLELADRLGDLVEVQGLHLVCGLLYLLALRYPEGIHIEAGALEKCVRQVVSRLGHPHVDPALREDPEGESRRTMRWLGRKRMLRLESGAVLPECARILAAPPLESKYRKLNPVKHHVNQILHLKACVALLEEAAQELAARK